MKIYGVVLSPYVRKVLAVCSIKGLEYEVQPVMPGTGTTTPEYLRLSPLGKVPAFEDGDLGISDSSVICEYLEEKYPAVATMPSSPEDRARSRWLEEYGDTKLVESIAPFFFERKVKKLLGRGEADEAKLQRLATEEIPVCLAYLESQVPDSGFFFTDLGVADIAIASPFLNGRYGGYEVDAEAEAFPKTVAYIQRVIAHPLLAPILAAEQEMLGAMFAD